MLYVTQKACNVLQNPKFASEEVQKKWNLLHVV